MQQTWSFHDTTTGLFSGTRLTCSPAQLEANTPPGHAPMAGLYDPLSQRVDLATGQVVAYQPPAPADDDLRTWSWDEGTQRWVPTPTLVALRAKRWAEIKAARDAAEAAGFTWDGSTFDSDLQSQGRIQGAVQLALLAAQAQEPFAIAWTLADNTVRTLDGADAVAVGLALAAHVQAVFGHGRDLRAQIDAAASAEELQLIEW